MSQNVKASAVSLRILHIEDNRGDAELFRMAFQQVYPTAELELAGSAEEGLGRLAQNEQAYDLIFLDLNLPRMKGADFLQELNAYVHASRVPVMVLTSSDQPEDIDLSYKYMVSGYFVKPSDIKDYRSLARYVVQCWIGDPPDPLTTVVQRFPRNV